MVILASDALAGGGPAIWFLAALIVLVAGYVQGFTGMGFAVVSTPLLVLLVRQPHQVVMLSLVLGAILSAAVLVETRKGLRPGRSGWLIGGAVAGTPVGVVVLSHAAPRVLTVFIAATALVTAVTWLISPPRPVRHEATATAVAGLFGGFLNGATSMGGPPLALVVSMQRWRVVEGRAALAAFNLTSYLVGLATGMTRADTGFVVHGLILMPLGALGGVAGAWSVHRMPGHRFRFALLATVWLAGLSALASAFRS
ncbi:sulfite exporter TauE/SafE family protein [Amycolatopsis alkalitolerans]|uniref:Probable membrane transporter protein n=1 Tax=Amycolatopsis alkalitolerans TaxID=2547244 RepID=A0A5C4M2I6_9PSEU|nr:sulfite exporter TauE/SafE family protein [Amycolatopsis alkalitolerans]TNC25110.1 sulfite exporter TauE/SafE family protein [Amycolatopsis alkalitolerans]